MIFRFLVLAGLVFSASLAGADPTASKPCGKTAVCIDGQACISDAAGSRCVRSCDPKKPASACPPEQRCIKHGPVYACHHVEDGLGL